MKDISLNILSYLALAILFVYGAYNEWKQGQKFISIVTVFVAIIMVWRAIDNYNKFKKQPNNLDNGQI